MISLLVVIGLIVIVALWFIGVQRKLVRLEEMMKNAIGQINAQLKSRWDAISNLVKMTAKYAAHEHDTLNDVIKQRRQTASTAEEVNSQNSAIQSVLGRLMVVAEQYPELKADEMFSRTMADITGYEEKVRLSRMVFNDSVTKLNTLIRQFPSSIVAGALHFTTKEYLAEDQAKSEAPDINEIYK